MAWKGLEPASKDLEKSLYDAFNKAYMTQDNGKGGDTASFTNKVMTEAADKFATVLAADMAEAIKKFVLELKVDITVGPTVVAPSGPCSGTIPFAMCTVS